MFSKLELNYFTKAIKLAAKFYTFPFDWNENTNRLSLTKSKWKRICAIYICPVLHLIDLIFLCNRLSSYKTLADFASFTFCIHAILIFLHGYTLSNGLGSNGCKEEFIDLINQLLIVNTANGKGKLYVMC